MVRKLISLLNGEDVRPEATILPVTLVVRDSA
jgi:hypothetical protein